MGRKELYGQKVQVWLEEEQCAIRLPAGAIAADGLVSAVRSVFSGVRFEKGVVGITVVVGARG